jgi:hypothetical protein
MKKVLLVLFATLTLLVAGACGDDSDSDNGSDAVASDEAKTDTSSGSDAKGSGGGEFCELARKFDEEFDDAGTGEGDDQAAVFKDLRNAIEQLEDKAPDDIEDDVTTVADAFRQSDDILKKYDYDFTKIPEAEASKISLQNPKVVEASNNVESYFEKKCGIDSDGDGDTDGVIESTTTTPDDGTSTDDGETTDTAPSE